MNHWNLSAQSLGLYVEFKKDGEFFPPDAGSIKLTIRSNSGIPMTGYDRAAQADLTTTTTLFTIPQEVNIINERQESRFIRVDYTVGGVPCVWIDVYKLTAFVPLTAVTGDVRNLLGVRYDELKDEEIDLYEAYFSLLRTNPLMAAAIIAGDDTTIFANKAIALKAALILIPSMPVRVMKQDALNNATLLRATIDWMALEAALEGQLNGALGSIDPSAVIGGFQLNPIFVLVTPTDPVTNA